MKNYTLTEHISMKNNKLIDFLLEHNRNQSINFCDTANKLWRQEYREKHPTEIIVLKCMDGRLHLSIMTGTPLGIIQPFRNIGGKFKLGWPYFGSLLKESVDYAESRKRDCLILVTYHFSNSNPHLGCKGFNYDTQEAKRSAEILVSELKQTFIRSDVSVYPILVGIETDRDALIIHNDRGDTLELSQLDTPDEDSLREEVARLYPDMKLRIIDDLLPLLIGNIRHMKETSHIIKTPESIDHCEQVIGVGRGFDWLHKSNFALLVGPYSADLVDPIAKAAGILMSNIDAGRISKEDGVVLMSSAVYRKPIGADQKFAEAKAFELADISLDTIKKHVPKLLPYLNVLVGTVNMNTRLFTRLPFAIAEETTDNKSMQATTPQ